MFTFLCQKKFQLSGMVKMILNSALDPAGNKYDFLYSGINSFLNQILNNRLIHNRKHFFWLGFGGRKKAGAETSYRDDDFFDFRNHLNLINPNLKIPNKFKLQNSSIKT